MNGYTSIYKKKRMRSSAISWDDVSDLHEELLDEIYGYHNDVIAEIQNHKLPWWEVMFGWGAAGACIAWGILGGLYLWKFLFGSI